MSANLEVLASLDEMLARLLAIRGQIASNVFDTPTFSPEADHLFKHPLVSQAIDVELYRRVGEAIEFGFDPDSNTRISFVQRPKVIAANSPPDCPLECVIDIQEVGTTSWVSFELILSWRLLASKSKLTAFYTLSASRPSWVSPAIFLPIIKDGVETRWELSGSPQQTSVTPCSNSFTGEIPELSDVLDKSRDPRLVLFMAPRDTTNIIHHLSIVAS